MIAVLIGLGLFLFIGLRYWSARQHQSSASMRPGSEQMDIQTLAVGLREQLIEQLQRGRKIEAIDRLRREKGWSLKRSKAVVEALSASRQYDQYLDLRAQAQADDLSPELIRQVEGLLAAGEKIQAVHLVREQTDWGLKRSKEYVESLE